MSDITYARPLLAWNGLAGHAHWFLRVALSRVYHYHGITKLPALEGGALIVLGGFMSGEARRWLTRFGGSLCSSQRLSDGHR